MSLVSEVPYWFVGAAALAVGIVLLWVSIFFSVIPNMARRFDRMGKTGLAIRVMSAVVALPAPGGEITKVAARVFLGNLYFRSRRPQDAAYQFKLVLAQRISPGMVGDIRRRLGDCLDSLGQTVEAEFARSSGAAAVQGKSDCLSLIARGDLLNREHRYSEAIACYDQALALPTLPTSTLRSEILVKRGLAAFQAGRQSLTIESMELAIEAGAVGKYLQSAYSMAGVGYSSSGNLEKSEEYLTRAWEVAVENKDTKSIGNVRSMLVNIKKRRGKLDDAIAEFRAMPASVAAGLTYGLSYAECLQLMGRFAEAREALSRAEQADEIKQSIVPFHANRQVGVLKLARARVLIDEGALADAWNILQEAVAIFSGDGKVSLWCTAGGARILALQGHADAALEKMAAVEREMTAYSGDRETQTGCTATLALAAQALGDFARARDLWDRYLTLDLDPVARPRALFRRGECFAALADPARARALWQEALDMGIPTWEMELARERLAGQDPRD